MALAYRLSAHAQERMAQRAISVEEALAALHKHGRLSLDGIVEHFDPITQVVVKCNPAERTIITVYRRKRRRQERTTC